MAETAGIELFHGYTYSAHPLACAAALATLDLYRDEALFARARGLEGVWEAAVHTLAGAPHVIDIRNIGLVAGIELAPRAGAPGARAMDLFRTLFDAGLLVRATGDIIALSPPLIVQREHIDQMMDTLRAALRKVA
jgi:beta-alanine--pyruvate transaminase